VVLEAVKEKDPADECRLCTGRAGIREGYMPEEWLSAQSVRRTQSKKATETQRHRENKSLCLHVSVAQVTLCSRLTLCRRHLERVAEHDLRDSHDPRLDRRLSEVRVAHVVRPLDRTDVHSIEQVEHFDLQLRRMCAREPEVLDEHGVGVVLRRR